MSSMPFPNDTWNFQVVSLAGGALNRLVQNWGTMTFQTLGGHPQMVLQVGTDTSQPVNVTWSSVVPDLGTVTSNPSFIVGSHTYAFTTITIMSIPVVGGTHRVAFCLQITVDQTTAWFVALPNTSPLLPPKPADYIVSGGNPTNVFCTITPAAGGDISIMPFQGFTLHGQVVWHKPNVNWPPTISWSLKNTSSGAILSFSGVLTTSANPLLRQITWQFGGKFSTGGPATDDDWSSTTHSDPLGGVIAQKSYA